MAKVDTWQVETPLSHSCSPLHNALVLQIPSVGIGGAGLERRPQLRVRMGGADDTTPGDGHCSSSPCPRLCDFRTFIGAASGAVACRGKEQCCSWSTWRQELGHLWTFLYIPSLLQRRLAGNFATNPCEQALSQVSAEQGRGLLSYPNHFASIIIIMLCLLSCALKKCGASVVLVYCLS